MRANAGAVLVAGVSVRQRSRAIRCRTGLGIAALFTAAVVLLGMPPASRAQDSGAEEAAHRAAVLATLPEDAARRVFGLEATPAPGQAEAIGTYNRGCMAGAAQMPADGPDWQVMRPSRDRAWANPVLIAFLKQLAARAAREAGWPGLLIGDIAQPRGGPMLTGHASHQLGIEADIWLTPMPSRHLGREERDNMSAINLVMPGGLGVNPNTWRPEDFRILETAARMPGVDRIFVNAAIKKQLCAEAGADRGWLRKIRPWWGHMRHFHLRLACPAGEPECRNPIPPPPPGDGCGAALAWWFTPEALHPKPKPPSPPVLMSQMPRACVAVARAP